MAYNKAKAEKEWLRWKEAEEKKLRELGVDEETIQRLHTYDWAQFILPLSSSAKEAYSIFSDKNSVMKCSMSMY